MILLALLAAGLTTVPAVPLGMDTTHVGLGETVRIERPGTTAAYAVDVDIVEASVVATAVAILGRSPGTTRVTVVGPGGIETWNVVVEAPPSNLAAVRPDARRTAVWSEQYDSETSRVTTSLSVQALTNRRSLRRAPRLCKTLCGKAACRRIWPSTTTCSARR